jgi:hypothetical protein
VTKKEESMDRERFEHLLEAYGADFRRWPVETRAQAAAYAAQNVDAAAAIAEARALDQVLDSARTDPAPSPDLVGRILAQAPRTQRGFDRRAMLALAACAVFGVVLGYGGGQLAPPPLEDDVYFTMAFEAPFAFEDEG